MLSWLSGTGLCYHRSLVDTFRACPKLRKPALNHSGLLPHHSNWSQGPLPSLLVSRWGPDQPFPPLDRGGQSSSHPASGHLPVFTGLRVTTTGWTPGGGFYPGFEEHSAALVPLPFSCFAPLHIVGNTRHMGRVRRFLDEEWLKVSTKYLW